VVTPRLPGILAVVGSRSARVLVVDDKVTISAEVAEKSWRREPTEGL
jgi:hypothetical protein